MAYTFEVLADPLRRDMLDLLRQRPRAVNEFVDLLAINQPQASKQLKVLREAGLVSVQKDAQRRWYSLRPEPLAEVDAWLAPYRALWGRALDRLGNHLDAMPEITTDAETREEPTS